MPLKSLIVFDVSLNGRRVCRAGVGTDGVLSTIIDWVGGVKDGKKRPERLELHVGGLREDERGSSVHPAWADLKLRVGDRIVVRVGRAKSADRPIREKVWTADDTKRSQEKYLNHVAPQHGWVKRKARRRPKRL